MTEIAQAFEIHYATVSRIVKMTDNFWDMGDLIPLPFRLRCLFEELFSVKDLSCKAQGYTV